MAIALVATIATTLLIGHGARAEVPLLRDTYYEVAPTYQSGGISLGGHSATATGLHLQERNGFLGKALWTAVVAITMALGASDAEYLGSTYGPGYQIDYYRMKSDAELAQDAADRDASVDAAAQNEYQTNIYIYWPDKGLGSDTAGYIFETYAFSFNFGPSALDFGLVFSNLRSPCGKDRGASGGKCGSESIGIPFRLTFDLARIATLETQLDINFLAFGDDTTRIAYDHGFKVGVSLHPWQRLFVRGGITIPDFDFDELGFQLEAGLRF